MRRRSSTPQARYVAPILELRNNLFGVDLWLIWNGEQKEQAGDSRGLDMAPCDRKDSSLTRCGWRTGRVQHPQLEALHRHTWIHVGILGGLEAIVRDDAHHTRQDPEPLGAYHPVPLTGLLSDWDNTGHGVGTNRDRRQQVRLATGATTS